MPRVNRTPPSTPAIEVQRASSNPNISTSPTDSEFVNILQRSKRPRSETSPTNEFHEFKEEIRAMLSKWNANQETILQNFMSKITLELSELKTQYEQLQKDKLEIEVSAQLMSGKFEEIRTQMNKLENERAEQNNYIVQLENQINDAQENHRSSTIELRNVVTKENENTTDLSKIVLDICNLLKVQIKLEDIRDIYRVRNNKNSLKPIIVEFQSVMTKNNILQAVRNFNKGKRITEKLNSGCFGWTGEKVPIYIAERLLASQRKLFYMARKFANANSFQFCWVSNGKIFLRKKEGDKPVFIKTEKCFQNIMHPKE